MSWYNVDDNGYPLNYKNPDWDKRERVHDWRNYPTDEVRALWHTIPDAAKKALAKNFHEIADREEWD